MPQHMLNTVRVKCAYYSQIKIITKIFKQSNKYKKREWWE